MNEDEIEEVKDELMEEIDNAITHPVSPHDAFQVLESLRIDIEFRAGALREENQPESEAW